MGIMGEKMKNKRVASDQATKSARGSAAKAANRCDILINEKWLIPGWVHDLETFRRWAKSDEFPMTGRFSFLDGTIWVDLGPIE